MNMLRLYKNTDKTQQELASYLHWTRHKVRYHTQKLLDDNMIIRSKGSQYYKLTPSGRSFLGTYDKRDKKTLQAIENARWKTKIKNTNELKLFLKKYKFRKNTKMKNIIQWNGNIDGFTIQINEGKETSMIITHPTLYGSGLQSNWNQAESNIYNIIRNFNDKFNFNLTIPESLEAKQITLRDPISESLMKKTGGSQVKVGEKISFDQSYHSEPRSEFAELGEAIDWANMPKSIVRIEQKIDIMASSMNRMAGSFDKFTDMMGKAMGMDKTEDKLEIRKLNEDSKKMFG